MDVLKYGSGSAAERYAMWIVRHRWFWLLRAARDDLLQDVHEWLLECRWAKGFDANLFNLEFNRFLWSRAVAYGFVNGRYGECGRKTWLHRSVSFSLPVFGNDGGESKTLGDVLLTDSPLMMLMHGSMLNVLCLFWMLGSVRRF